MSYKLGSLFDGSGGFPLAGALCGIEPRWASEVEPYPIAVTRERFPNMVHLGDIRKINGAKIEPVDIVTFGSPCQDLSVAGKRAGLKHEANGDDETTRSGLFMEAVRIIKEMREATNGRYPTFALWENVPGAFSSNGGEDFRVVCEELIKIVEPSAVMPPVPRFGWAYADSYVGDGWSLAYRVFDAQYWGVPQRRRRIHLVLDLRGERAREILFEREGVRGYFAQGGTPRKATPADAQGGTGADDRAGEGFDGYNGDLTGDVSATIGVNCGVSTGRNGVIERSGDRGLDAIGLCCYNQALTGEKAKSLTGAATDSDHVPCIIEAPPPPVRYIVRRLTPTECARLQGFADWWGRIEQKDTLTPEEYRFWLEVRNTHAAINGKKVQEYTEKQMLTWYNKLWKDSAEYKMWGNGIALPPALYVMQGIADAMMWEV